MSKTKIPRRVWQGKRKPPIMPNLCVHCGLPLQQWEYLRNQFYHAACLLKIKRENL